MRSLNLLDVFRDHAWEARMGGPGDDRGGAFKVKSSIDGGELRIIASNGMGWDHVSVSRANRCPNWPEMEQVKRLFFRDDAVRTLPELSVLKRPMPTVSKAQRVTNEIILPPSDGRNLARPVGRRPARPPVPKSPRSRRRCRGTLHGSICQRPDCH